MTVSFHGREVEVVEVLADQRERLAELTDAIAELGKAGEDVHTVKGWRLFAAPLIECARMFTPSLTDADYKLATLSDYANIYVQGVAKNSASRIMHDAVNAQAPDALPSNPFVAQTVAQAEGYAQMAEQMKRPDLAEAFRKRGRDVAVAEKLRPGAFSGHAEA